MITQEQLEDIWTEADGDMDTACQMLEDLLKLSPETHWAERIRCRPILAAMRDQ
jgi:hypothetical protein